MASKMGEGWLLTAEMLELAENGYDNIICAQPFGCLPNHICGKGMIQPPDAGASGHQHRADRLRPFARRESTRKTASA